MSRPEQTAPPEIFYGDSEAKKYTSSSRIQHIQAEMTYRALDLLNLPPYQHVLDIGCGSGLSGEILTEEKHTWVGLDIAPSMLGEALDREVEGDLFLSDIGQGIPFRAGTFDAAISISVIQWLCNADSTNNNPKKRLLHFFNTLFSSLKRGGKFVGQFYPMNDTQKDHIQEAAKLAGFNGGLVIDGTEKKNMKYYLVLIAGHAESVSDQLNLEGVVNESKPKRAHKKRKGEETRREYIDRKKETMRKRGYKVAKDSKFTGRKRKPKF